jgi:hypothetical protein
LLIGQRALVALGASVMTADYDLWIHQDDIERDVLVVATANARAPRVQREQARASVRTVRLLGADALRGTIVGDVEARVDEGAAGFVVCVATAWGKTGVDDTVVKVAVGGGSPVTIADHQDSPAEIVVDSTSVYWSGKDGITKATPR